VSISVTSWVTAGVGLALVGLLGVQTVRLSSEKAAHATTKLEFADARTEASRLRAKAETEQREEYERRIGEKDATIQAAQSEAATARTALARSVRAGDSLRDERAAHIARAGQACSGAGTGPGGAPACPAIKLLDELFGQADSFAGDLAAAFEGSYIAGRACVRQYESLTPQLSSPATQ
jgi:hypothetical protein